MMKSKIFINGKVYDAEVRLVNKAAFLHANERVQDAWDELFTGSVTTPWVTGTNPDPRWTPIAETVVEDDALDALLGPVTVETPKVVVAFDEDSVTPEFAAWLKKEFNEEDSE